ncbi:MAG: hypothetical protein J0L92_01050 [Deltaproteobacteria bacterium]|nr:hypothetical protein [Deltaproteobacteria bacterium]
MSDEITALQDRIAKARAERAALDEAAERAVEIARLEKLARLEEQALKDAPHIAKGRDEHGVERTAVIDTDHGAIVVKKPHHLNAKKLAATGDKTSEADVSAFIRSCLVYPTWPEVERMLEDSPGVGGAIIDALGRLARGGAKERAGK